jgi:hypothetical protein
MERLFKDKRSSLFGHFVGDEVNTFYNTATWPARPLGVLSMVLRLPVF